MNQHLLAPITQEELTKVVKSIRADACPGDDGLPLSFYTTYWDTLLPRICSGLNDILIHGDMPEILLDGVIFLIPKGDGRSLNIKDWRPITILNVT